MWVGRRPSLEEMARCAASAAPRSTSSTTQLAKNAEETLIRVLRGRPGRRGRRAASTRSAHGHRATTSSARTPSWPRSLSELRLVKDDVRDRADAPGLRQTAEGFAAVVADLPEAVRRGRGERWVEGIFGLHARHVGNAIGYDTIAASGDHACTLHWIRNDGDLREGDLLLLDAGVELDTLYTADVTRTLPVNGRFSDAQRKVYEAVLEAQQAGIDAAQPGREVLRRAHGGDRRDRASSWRSGGCCRSPPRSRSIRRRRPAPPLDGARHLAPPRHRRARLRPGPPGELPGGHAASRAW